MTDNAPEQINPQENANSHRKIHCPSCKTEMIWSSTNPWRPFCSETCKNRDFLGWANEQHRIPTDNDENYDE